jgi:ABC-type branched-subunit amino acid transport system ATPase component
MRRPKVLLLDEPASGLLAAELDELDQVLRILVREMKIALLLVEHRLELLAAIADQVLVLDVGQCIATGTPEDVFGDSKVQAAYFESATA